MAINFPNSPSLNEEYTNGSTTWIWDGTKWLLKIITDSPIEDSNTIIALRVYF